MIINATKFIALETRVIEKSSKYISDQFYRGAKTVLEHLAEEDTKGCLCSECAFCSGEHCDNFGITVHKDDFCSWGEPREEQTDDR